MPRHRRTRRAPRTSGAGRLVAVALLAVAGVALIVGSIEMTGRQIASTQSANATQLPDLPDRDTRVSRGDRPDVRRTGRVPSPNAASRRAPEPPKPSPKPAPAWVAPATDYRVTSGYGMRWGSLHAGVDLAGSSGSPIRASHSGTVTTAGWYGGYGYAVIIEHGNSISTLYGHNSRVLVGEGDRVRTGQRVALMGSTGYSTGTHLHFEVHLGEDPVDPVPWMRNRGVRL